MARTALLYAATALLLTTSWLGLEDPRRSGAAVAAAAVALLPALVRPWWARAAAALAAAIAVVPAALGLSPVRAGDYPPLAGRFWDGVLEFYDVTVPFDPAAHPRMHGVVTVAVLAFCLPLGFAIAARRPTLASLVLAAGVAWPATLVPEHNGLRLGGFLLAAVLVLYAGLRRGAAGSVRPALAVGALLLLAALGAATSPAVAKDAFLGWERWTLRDRSEKPVSVGYVWDSRYGGIDFPKKVTTVLAIEAPTARPLYWRATVLDSFDGRGWSENLRPAGGLREDGDFTRVTGAEYPAAAAGRDQVEQRVEVVALDDDHLVGASVPTAYTAPRDRSVEYKAGGVAVVSPGIRRGDVYSVRSYAPSPPARLLRQSAALYPAPVRDADLGLAGVDVPPYGAPNRDAELARLVAGDASLAAYEPVFAQARRLGGAAQSPYQATVAIEAWLRSLGGFQYDQHPSAVPGVPPLVGFVTTTKRGYCQHFAGAMAVMLRYLGIPARVAAGFTSGTYDRDSHTWTVTDHDAHTWVEAWFRGYGWLPFDPTPGRGVLAGSYTSASSTFDPAAAGAFPQQFDLSRNAFNDRIARGAELARGATIGGGDSGGGNGRAFHRRGSSLLLLVAIVLASIVALIALAKLAVRRGRYATHDPRRLASACRRELVDFLADQRLEPDESATLAELNATLERRLGVSGRAFVAAATAARFASPELAAAEARRARRELRSLLAAVRRRLSAGERIRGLLSLRSLGFR